MVTYKWTREKTNPQQWGRIHTRVTDYLSAEIDCRTETWPFSGLSSRYSQWFPKKWILTRRDLPTATDQPSGFTWRNYCFVGFIQVAHGGLPIKGHFMSLPVQSAVTFLSGIIFCNVTVRHWENPRKQYIYHQDSNHSQSSISQSTSTDHCGLQQWDPFFVLFT